MDDVEPVVFEWVEEFAQRLGVDAPSRGEMAALLDLAGVAARASARQAAPIACWLAAKAGVDPADAIAVARRPQGSP
jgi:hypothetical protein